MNSIKILFVTRNLPPLVGGMERLCRHIIGELNQNHNEIHVIGPKGCSEHLPSNIITYEAPIRPLWRFFLATAIHCIKNSVRLRPGLIFSGSGLTAPFVLFAARLINSPCILYLHGLDIVVRHPIYRLLWRRNFKKFDKVIVNSHYTYELAIQAGIRSELLTILNPGVELPDIKSAENHRLAFRKYHNLGQAPVALFVGRITARKGLTPFIYKILPLVLKELPDTKFVIIGEKPKESLNKKFDRGLEQTIYFADNAELQQCIHYLGRQDDSEVTAAYFSADVLVFPVQEQPNDNEGFGMVAIEAAAHGLSTVAFSVGGIPDSVADGISGRLITPGDNQAFANALVSYLRYQGKYKQKCREYSENFEWTVFGEQLRLICKKVIEK